VGRRRLAAARVAGLDTVPCIVRAFTDGEAGDASLAENLHRRQLSPIEEALGYLRLQHRGLAQAEIARRVGRSQACVSRHLRLLALGEITRGKVHLGLLSVAAALGETNAHHGPGDGGHAGRGKPMGDDEMAMVSHWRRRHDRIMEGLRVIIRTRGLDGQGYRQVIERLIRLDTQPLDEIPEERDWRQDWKRSG
jgi:hypothetical protein